MDDVGHRAHEEVVRQLRAGAEELADAVLARVQAQGAGAAPADPATLRNLRLGARASVEVFLARLDAAAGGDPQHDLGQVPAGTVGSGGGARDAGSALALFVAHGRAQQAAGRSLAELLAFYRLGGLAMWEGARLAIPASRALPAEAIFALGTEVLATVDALSVAAVEGFTAQEAETLRHALARRERLASLLLSDRHAPPAQLAAAAEAAGWRLPPRVRVALAALPVEPPPGSSLAGPARVLGATVDGGRRALVVADDAEAERWLLRAARAQHLPAPLSLGPSVEPAQAARSLARAGALLDQAGAHIAASAARGSGEDDGERSGAAAAHGPGHRDGEPSGGVELLRCDEHEIDLLLGAAPELAGAVAQRRLAPLEALPARQRARLLETLAGWLAHPARPQAIADALDVHVQTVRYRLRQLRELLGDALDDPEARFELSVALRARALADTSAAAHRTA